MVEGNVPRWLLGELKRRYGQKARSVAERPEEGESIPLEGSAWYRRIRRETTPGDALRLYRENRGLSQTRLAGLLGPGVRKQHVSGMENGHRGISKGMAKRLGRIFSASPERFI